MENSKQAYISYSRRSDCSFIKELLAAADDATQLRSLAVSETGGACIQPLTEPPPDPIDPDDWILLYDENSAEPFDSIRSFMEELSEGERIIVLLSAGYFRSPYCMVELLSIYAKRARELIPIIVFVDGYGPGDVSVPKLVEYWDRQRAKAEQEGNGAAACCYADFIQKLRDALAWLLGSFDQAMRGWDTLFPVIDGQSDGAVQKVLDALSAPLEPRYTHCSAKSKTALISNEISRILARKELGDWFKGLKKRFPAEIAEGKDLADVLARPGDAAGVTEYLDRLIEWLDEIIKESQPSKLRQSLAGAVKELAGWILLTAVDDGKLHRLIHALNRLQAEASHEMVDENETAFQMIASAVGSSPVRYRFDAGSDEGALRGEGQLDPIERGVDRNNYEQCVASETRWLPAEESLYHQMTLKPRRQKTRKAVQGAMDAILRHRHDFYLLFDKRHLEISRMHDFRRHLGERFPSIQQIISHDDAGVSAEDYYLDGLNSGDIDEQIFMIYSRIHELSQ